MGVPIQNLPFLYDNNLLDTFETSIALHLSAGQCRDSTNTYDIVLENALTLNAAARGFNGLDAGSLANNTWYYMFVISDPISGNPTGALLSVSKTAPIMPYGYSVFRYIGAWLTNGSAQLLPIYKYGNAGYRTCWWDTPISVLSGGTAATFTAISLAAAIPPLSATAAIFTATVTPTAAGNDAKFRPTGSASATGLARLSGSVAAVPQEAQIVLPSLMATVSAAVVPAIDYLVTGSLTLTVAGFFDYV